MWGTAVELWVTVRLPLGLVCKWARYLAEWGRGWVAGLDGIARAMERGGKVRWPGRWEEVRWAREVTRWEA
jgi:hypothetical protein